MLRQAPLRYLHYVDLCYRPDNYKDLKIKSSGRNTVTKSAQSFSVLEELHFVLCQFFDALRVILKVFAVMQALDTTSPDFFGGGAAAQANDGDAVGHHADVVNTVFAGAGETGVFEAAAHVLLAIEIVGPIAPGCEQLFGLSCGFSKGGIRETLG